MCLLETLDTLIAIQCENDSNIIFGAVCDESSIFWDKVSFFREKLLIHSPQYRQGLVFVYEVSKKKIKCEYSKNPVLSYRYKNYNFLAESQGFMNNRDKGIARFTINNKKYELKNNRGLNILVWNVQTETIDDLYSVDLFSDSKMIVKRNYPPELSELTYILDGNEQFDYILNLLDRKISNNEQIASSDFPISYPYNGESSKKYIELIFRSGNLEYLEKAMPYLIKYCDPNSSVDNRIILYSLLHNNSQNVTLAKQYQRKIAYLDNPALCKFLKINEKIIKMNHLVIRSSYEDYKIIMSTCLQFHIYIDYFCPIGTFNEKEIIGDIIDDTKILQLDGNVGIIYFTENVPIFNPNLTIFKYTDVSDNGLFEINNSEIDQQKPLVIMNDDSSNYATKIYSYFSRCNYDVSIVSISLMKNIPKNSNIICLTTNTELINDIKEYSKLYVDPRPFNKQSIIIRCSNNKYDCIKFSDLCIKYMIGKGCYDRLNEFEPYGISQWEAVGDSTKIASILASNRCTNTFIIPINRSYLRRMYPSIKYEVISEKEYSSLKTFLDLSFKIRTNKIQYWTLGGPFIIPNMYGYKSMCDHDMLCNLLCVPSTSKYTHSDIQSVANEYSDAVLLVPDASWTFNQDAHDYIAFMERLLNDLCDLLMSQGIHVFSNSKGNKLTIKNAECVTLDLTTLCSIASTLKAVVGPMTGLIDFLSLSNCKNVQVVYKNDNDRRWYNINRMLEDNHCYHYYKANFDEYEDILHMILNSISPKEA